MTNADKFLHFAIWAGLLGFITYQLLQEMHMRDQCHASGGVMVISSQLNAVCVQRAPGATTSNQPQHHV